MGRSLNYRSGNGEMCIGTHVRAVRVGTHYKTRIIIILRNLNPKSM